VSEEKEFRRSYYRLYHNAHGNGVNSVAITSYNGTTHDPEWTDVEPSTYACSSPLDGSLLTRADMFSRLCIVQADMSHIVLQPQRGKGGAIYYRRDFDVMLLFGLTELKAQICWTEDVSYFLSLICFHSNAIYCRAKKNGKDPAIMSPFISLTSIYSEVQLKSYMIRM
jgi:hypothetical protein